MDLLGEFYVQFSSVGIDEIKADADRLREKIKEALGGIGTFAEVVEQKIRRLFGGIDITPARAQIQEMLAGVDNPGIQRQLDDLLVSVASADFDNVGNQFDKLVADVKTNAPGISDAFEQELKQVVGAAAGARREIHQQLQEMTAIAQGATERSQAARSPHELRPQLDKAISSVGMMDFSGAQKQIKEMLRDLNGINFGKDKAGQQLKADFVGAMRDLSAEAERGQEKVTKMMGAIAGAGHAVKVAFLSATATVSGFVTAGISSSVVGQQLSFVMGELSRTIAGIFGPEIRAVIELIRDIMQWFRSLSAAQLESLAYWAKFIFVFGSIVLIGAKVLAMVSAITFALFGQTAAQIALNVATGNWVLAAAGAAALAAAMAAAAYAAHKAGEFGSGKGKDDRGSLAPVSSGFEAVEASYQRVAQLSIAMTQGRETKTDAQRQIDIAEEQRELQRELNRLIERQRPAAARA